MRQRSSDLYRLTAEAFLPGTTLVYHHRDGADVATVTEADGRVVAFAGDDVDGRFTYGQIEILLESGRLEVVLTDA
ncbi:hypothetical protein [Halovivax gelatinilyticus]|uniref:hypothetical protein n=1 Tax=Halovivax gelatinilyticus TaxID=2961597 RepID=UPI0020CA27B8|nr:hypothetical protein [Halovivax gelatinilyticus]